MKKKFILMFLSKVLVFSFLIMSVFIYVYNKVEDMTAIPIPCDEQEKFPITECIRIGDVIVVPVDIEPDVFSCIHMLEAALRHPSQSATDDLRFYCPVWCLNRFTFGVEDIEHRIIRQQAEVRFTF